MDRRVARLLASTEAPAAEAPAAEAPPPKSPGRRRSRVKLKSGSTIGSNLEPEKPKKPRKPKKPKKPK